MDSQVVQLAVSYLQSQLQLSVSVLTKYNLDIYNLSKTTSSLKLKCKTGEAQLYFCIYIIYLILVGISSSLILFIKEERTVEQVFLKGGFIIFTVRNYLTLCKIVLAMHLKKNYFFLPPQFYWKKSFSVSKNEPGNIP